MNVMQYPVNNIDDAYNACDPEEALPAGDERYQDLNPVRGGNNVAEIIARRIRRVSRGRDFHQQLLTGHRGCGKTTELSRLQERLGDQRFFSVYLDVEEHLDLGDLVYLDILLAIAKVVEAKLREAKIGLDQKLISELEHWFAEIEESEEHHTSLDGAVKTEAEVGAGIPLLGKLLANLTSQISSGSSRRQVIRRTLGHDLNVFLDRLNALLFSARQGIKKAGFGDLIVIVDGLEKMHFRELDDGQSNHRVIFVEHAEQLKAPRCHIIYTIPISLVFNANLSDTFTDPAIVLPMVKFQTSDGKQALRDLVARRIQLDLLFEDPDLVNELIAMSGGAVRDLMRLIRMACDRVDDVITAADVEAAIQQYVREFDRLLREEDLESLRYVRQNRRTADAKFSRPLNLRLIHEYQNSERWADLHPALQRLPWVEEALRDGHEPTSQ